MQSTLSKGLNCCRGFIHDDYLSRLCRPRISAGSSIIEKEKKKKKVVHERNIYIIYQYARTTDWRHEDARKYSNDGASHMK